MLCPICNVDLLLSEKQGIEIDYCPKCRGIWLDRGELDKIIERSSEDTKRSSSDYKNDSRDRQYIDDNQYKKDGYKHGSYGNPHYKKKSFLSDLFDF